MKRNALTVILAAVLMITMVLPLTASVAPTAVSDVKAVVSASSAAQPAAQPVTVDEAAAQTSPSSGSSSSVASSIKAANPNFANANANGNSKLWFNKKLNAQYDAYVDAVVSNSYSSNRFRYDYAFEKTLFDMVNKYRVSNGRDALIWSDNLARVARLRVSAGVDASMTHDISEVGGLPIDTANDVGWAQKTLFGENIVGKASTASVNWPSRAGELLQMWKDSPGHNENMLEERFHYGAIAIVISDNSFGRGITGAWALQLFAG